MPTLGTYLILIQVGGWSGPEFSANTNNFDTSFKLKPRKFESVSTAKKKPDHSGMAVYRKPVVWGHKKVLV